jgi:hypothetical protein
MQAPSTTLVAWRNDVLMSASSQPGMLSEPVFRYSLLVAAVALLTSTASTWLWQANRNAHYAKQLSLISIASIASAAVAILIGVVTT